MKFNTIFYLKGTHAPIHVLQYSETCDERPLQWETDLWWDHCYCNMALHFYIFIPVMRDHLSRKTTFCGPMGWCLTTDLILLLLSKVLNEYLQLISLISCYSHRWVNHAILLCVEIAIAVSWAGLSDAIHRLSDKVTRRPPQYQLHTRLVTTIRNKT